MQVQIATKTDEYTQLSTIGLLSWIGSECQQPKANALIPKWQQ